MFTFPYYYKHFSLSLSFFFVNIGFNKGSYYENLPMVRFTEFFIQREEDRLEKTCLMLSKGHQTLTLGIQSSHTHSVALGERPSLQSTDLIHLQSSKTLICLLFCLRNSGFS